MTHLEVQQYITLLRYGPQQGAANVVLWQLPAGYHQVLRYSHSGVTACVTGVTADGTVVTARRHVGLSQHTVTVHPTWHGRITGSSSPQQAWRTAAGHTAALSRTTASGSVVVV